ncbi:MAG: hypothetical protein DRN29_04250 [Thermoplasmata archaeon]|nr:MAG: hypothetical protein DRN29_04250 [Thermoplasmata archaeon]
MKNFHEAVVRTAFKIAIPFLFICLLFGIFLLFHDFWIGVLSVVSSTILLSLSIIAFKWYKKDKESFLKAHISAIVWRDFAILLFFSLFFLFPAITSFYSGDTEAAKFFILLFLIFLALASLIYWQNKKIKL